MTTSTIALPLALLAALLASCKESATERTQTEGSPSALQESAPSPESAPARPAPPSAEVLAALKEQEFGRKLLGKTMFLVGDKFVQADLRDAPDYYLVHYSASW